MCYVTPSVSSSNNSCLSGISWLQRVMSKLFVYRALNTSVAVAFVRCPRIPLVPPSPSRTHIMASAEVEKRVPSTDRASLDDKFDEKHAIADMVSTDSRTSLNS